MKKIGILTYLKEYANIGTNMQSYCTLNAIRKAYPDAKVELINYAIKKPFKKLYLSNISFDSVKKDFIRFKKYKEFFKNELSLSEKELISSNFDKSIEFIKKHNYQAIFVGSDTVLELKGNKKDSLNAYWLSHTIECKKFFIAASSHNVIYEELSENQRKQIKNTLDGFSLLGVRDEATFRLISNFILKKDDRLQIIPDPTFTYEIDYNFVGKYIKRLNLNISKPMICFHLLRNTKWASELSDYFRKQGYLIASLRPAYYADIILTDLSPFEQVGLYKYFSLVITHRFHDSIFCFKNLTPVIAFPEFASDVTKYGESKNLSLFKSFNVEKTNYIENYQNITAKHLINIHREAIANFKKNEDHIRKTLRKHKENYEYFVKKSRKICVE